MRSVWVTVERLVHQNSSWETPRPPPLRICSSTTNWVTVLPSQGPGTGLLMELGPQPGRGRREGLGVAEDVGWGGREKPAVAWPTRDL